MDAETNFPFLKELISDPDERIRQSAIRVIGNLIDHEKYLDLFRAVLTGGKVPNEVLKVIGEKRLTAFRQLLLDIVLDPLQMLWTKYYAMVALGAFADQLFAHDLSRGIEGKGQSDKDRRPQGTFRIEGQTGNPANKAVHQERRSRPEDCRTGGAGTNLRGEDVC